MTYFYKFLSRNATANENENLIASRELKIRLLLFFIFSASFLLAVPAASAEFSLFRSGVQMKGTIVKGDYKKLATFIRDSHFGEFTERFFLDSNGGDVVEAMKIANLVNKMYGHTVVKTAGNCFSACAVIWAGGVVRTIGEEGRLGLHRISLVSDEPSVSKTEQKIRPVADSVESFLLRMGIPRRLLDKMNETSSTDLFLIDTRWLQNEELYLPMTYSPIFVDVAQKRCGTNPLIGFFKSNQKLLDPTKLEFWNICLNHERFRISFDERNLWWPLLTREVEK